MLRDIYRMVRERQEEEEEETARRRRETRQSRRFSILLTPIAVFTTAFTAALGVQTSMYLLSPPTPPTARQILENDPQCGLTTGGQEECYWDCQRFYLAVYLQGTVAQNPECVADCFPEDHCAFSLLEDYSTAGGICAEGLFQYDAEIPNPWPLSSTSCTAVNTPPTLTGGLCRPQTEAKLLMDDDCLSTISQMPSIIYYTIFNLVLNMCNDNVFQHWYQYRREQFIDTTLFPGDIGRKKKQMTAKNGNYTRLPPTVNILPLKGGDVFRTELPYTNTRHRYPWICSLRTKGLGTEHLCAVTLLSRPPRPTVMVGSAHCTYLCKRDSTTILPTCCCADGPQNCAQENPSCGTEPRVYEMTGDDAEILCGEWETGPSRPDSSGEKYNVILPILEIVRHPDWDTSPGIGGPGAGNDIAVFKVNDDRLRAAENHNIYPSCLPPKITPEITDRNGDQVKVILAQLLQLQQWLLSLF